MVLTHPFRNPTRIIQGYDFHKVLFELLQGRRWALVTSQGWIKRGAVKELVEQCGEPTVSYFDCKRNPTIQTVLNITSILKDVDLYVGLGGGSVIDALKGAAVLCALDYDMDTFVNHLRNGIELPNDLPSLPLVIAISPPYFIVFLAFSCSGVKGTTDVGAGAGLGCIPESELC